MEPAPTARKSQTKCKACRLAAAPSWVLALTLAVAYSPAFAQDATLNGEAFNSAATRIASVLHHARARKILVLDFTGPDNALTSFGVQLAHEFSSALATSDPKLHVEDRPEMQRQMDQAGYTIEALIVPGLGLQMAYDFHMDAAVEGTISRDGDQIKISLSAKRVKHGKLLDTEQMTISATLEATKSMQEFLAISDGLPDSGKNGYSYPRCLSCPEAPYTQSALRNKTHGTVILLAIITPDGRASELTVAKSLPDGLTQSAINTALGWRFAPATGPDGKPAAVRQVIEVMFHLYY